MTRIKNWTLASVLGACCLLPASFASAQTIATPAVYQPAQSPATVSNVAYRRGWYGRPRYYGNYYRRPYTAYRPYYGNYARRGYYNSYYGPRGYGRGYYGWRNYGYRTPYYGYTYGRPVYGYGFGWY
jgi:hypothetical protein